MGNRSKATGYEGYSIGSYAEANADHAYSFGRYALANGANSFSMGHYTDALASGSMVIGSGINTSTKLSNNVANSLMVGYNSDVPTLFVGASTGAGTTGNVGIGTSTPAQKLDVAGTTKITHGPGDWLQLNNDNGSGFWSLNNPAPQHQLRFMFDNNGTTIIPFTISNNGDVSVSGNITMQTGSVNGYIPVSDATGKMVWTDPSTLGIGNNHWQVNPTNSSHIVFNTGNVSIGTNKFYDSNTSTEYKLSVAGNARFESIEVSLESTWPDYVFDKEYDLAPIDEVEAFIQENKHLPNVPSETEVAENGINVAEMNAVLLRKIEEQTLYIIDLNKKYESLQNELKTLKKED